MNSGYIREFADLFHLPEHSQEISQMEGFGEKSCQNMKKAFEKSRNVHPVNLIYALCIPMIGIDAAKKIVNHLGIVGILQRMEALSGFEEIEGIGGEKSNSILNWYSQENNRITLEHLLQEVTLEQVEIADTSQGKCVGITFVITGDVRHYKSREDFKAYVESQGGKVAGSVSKKTGYLVNNDVESLSSKNKKAKDLGVPIISEDEFINLFG